MNRASGPSWWGHQQTTLYICLGSVLLTVVNVMNNLMEKRISLPEKHDGGSYVKRLRNCQHFNDFKACSLFCGDDSNF